MILKNLDLINLFHYCEMLKVSKERKNKQNKVCKKGITFAFAIFGRAT